MSTISLSGEVVVVFKHCMMKWIPSVICRLTASWSCQGNAVFWRVRLLTELLTSWSQTLHVISGFNKKGPTLKMTFHTCIHYKACASCTLREETRKSRSLILVSNAVLYMYVRYQRPLNIESCPNCERTRWYEEKSRRKTRMRRYFCCEFTLRGSSTSTPVRRDFHTFWWWILGSIFVRIVGIFLKTSTVFTTN